MDIPREIESVLLLNPNEKVVQWWDNIFNRTPIKGSYNKGFLVLTNQRTIFVWNVGTIFSNFEIAWKINLERIENLTVKYACLQIDDFEFNPPSEGISTVIFKTIMNERNKSQSNIEKETSPAKQMQHAKILFECPNCGKTTPEGKFCEHCGQQLS